MQTSYTNFQCKSELLLHPIESFLILLTKLVLLGQKYIWPEPDHQINIGPMGRDRSHRDFGHDSSASSGKVWKLDMV